MKRDGACELGRIGLLVGLRHSHGKFVCVVDAEREIGMVRTAFHAAERRAIDWNSSAVAFCGMATAIQVFGLSKFLMLNRFKLQLNLLWKRANDAGTRSHDAVRWCHAPRACTEIVRNSNAPTENDVPAL
jgi:hypothetical protein